MWITFDGRHGQHGKIVSRLAALGWGTSLVRYSEGLNCGISIGEGPLTLSTGTYTVDAMLSGNEEPNHRLGDLDVLINTDRYKYPLAPYEEPVVYGRCVPLF